MDARVESRMALTLPSAREIAFTREFDAPRRLVFQAWTEPEHMARWFGCNDSTLIACEVDLRVHGAYRIVMAGPDGAEHTLTGFYCEITRPERLVYTESYIGPAYQSAEVLVTATFVEQAGRTRLTCTILHKSAEDRARHLGTGFEVGMAEMLDRLASHLPTMA